MKRDLPALCRPVYDVVVIGGGIHGICTLYEAARRGLSACLLERGDFVGATSSNSLKTIHGGLRYLQHADLGRMRESIRERARLLRAAPHLVRPLPFVLPTSGYGLRSKGLMRVALALNDAIGFDRSTGVVPGRDIPRGRVIGREEMKSLVPGLDDPELTGGAHVVRLPGGQHRATGAGLPSLLGRSRRPLCQSRRGHRPPVGEWACRRCDGSRRTDRRFLRRASSHRRQRRRPLGRPGPSSATRREARPTRFHTSKAFNLVTRQLYAGHARRVQGAHRFHRQRRLAQQGRPALFRCSLEKTVAHRNPASPLFRRPRPFPGDRGRHLAIPRRDQRRVPRSRPVPPGCAWCARGHDARDPAPRHGRGSTGKALEGLRSRHRGSRGAVLDSRSEVDHGAGGRRRGGGRSRTHLRPGSRPARPAERPLFGADIEDLDRFFDRWASRPSRRP